MRSAGIDLSSQPVGTAACLVDWRAGIARVEAVESLVDDGRLQTLLADTMIDQVGIMCCLAGLTASCERCNFIVTDKSGRNFQLRI